MAYLDLLEISKRFNGHAALEMINLTAAEGSIVSLLGPSGCGKTTLLRIIAGLTAPDSGEVRLNGRSLKDVPPHGRRFGLMFQEFALFPHKNVFDNVAFGLQMQGASKSTTRSRALEMLELVGLAGFEERNVADLSGGERQRVALARTLAPQPRLLMLDEPLGALDRALRRRLMLDLIRILRDVRVTTIIVTHDQAEAFAMADTVAVMNAGRIEQIATPETLYKHPANAVVARFLGFENLIPGKVAATGKVATPLGVIATDTCGQEPGRAVEVLLRPEGAEVFVEMPPPYDARPLVIQGTVLDRIFLGYCCRLRLKTASGLVLSFDISNESPPSKPTDTVWIVPGPSSIAII